MTSETCQDSSDPKGIRLEDSVNSETMHTPLPEGLDKTGFEASSEPSLESVGDYSPSDGYEPPPNASEHPKRPAIGDLDSRAAYNLRSMIEDGCLSTPPTFKFVMSWGRPDLSDIFRKKRVFEVPKPVMELIEPALPAASSHRSAPLPSDKVTRGCYGEVINFNVDLTENDMEEADETCTGEMVHSFC